MALVSDIVRQALNAKELLIEEAQAKAMVRQVDALDGALASAGLYRYQAGLWVSEVKASCASVLVWLVGLVLYGARRR